MDLETYYSKANTLLEHLRLYLTLVNRQSLIPRETESFWISGDGNLHSESLNTFVIPNYRRVVDSTQINSKSIHDGVQIWAAKILPYLDSNKERLSELETFDYEDIPTAIDAYDTTKHLIRICKGLIRDSVPERYLPVLIEQGNIMENEVMNAEIEILEEEDAQVNAITDFDSCIRHRCSCRCISSVPA